MHIRRVWKLLGLSSLLAASVAHAAASGDALLIGDDGPSPGRRGPGCTQTVAAVKVRLEQLGLTVHSLVNPSATSLRSALDAFADEMGGVPSGTDLIYLCTPAIAEQSRLFVLPSGTGGAPADLQTQGVVLQALQNALAGTGGTLYADLLVTGDVNGEHRPPLPDGLRMVLNEDAQGRPHLVGTALSAPGFPLDQDWAVIAAAFRPVGEDLVILPPAASAPPVALPSGTQPQPGPLPATSPAPAPAAEPPPPLPAALPQKPPDGRGAKTKTGAAPTASRSRDSSSETHQYPRPAAATPEADLPAGPRTARIEAALARRGAYAGPIDGKYTQAVVQAVRNFQRQLGDLPTGALTPAEIVRLLNF